MLPAKPKELHVLVSDLILGFNSQLETTANMLLFLFVFFLNTLFSLKTNRHKLRR